MENKSILFELSKKDLVTYCGGYGVVILRKGKAVYSTNANECEETNIESTI